MKSIGLVMALAGVSALVSIVAPGAGIGSLVVLPAASVAAAVPRPASDTAKAGLSGKLNGPLFSFLTRKPFAEKVNGRIGQYLIGFWPAEQRRVSSVAYQNPRGFIEVTPENQDARISEHFTVRDFLTKGQVGIWPKYLVLREELVDKLELVIDDLNGRGVSVRHLSVMSGFRTPSYNGPGGDGRSGMSRHMYGDAADVFVDNDRNGQMDDLNRDGKVDHRDARVILESVERVERRYPALAGGVGVYRATAGHGPFAHVDVRGWRARWGLIG